MFLIHRIRVLRVGIPQRRPHNPVADIGIHDLEPARSGIIAELTDLPVAQLDEAGGAGVVAKEPPDSIRGHGVAFAFALDDVVEFDVVVDFAEDEGHDDLLKDVRLVRVYLCWR